MMLYINDMPVGCLSSVSRSEQISFIGTCKTSQSGAQTQLGRLYTYSIPFEGVMTTDNSIMSWTGLKALERVKSRLGNYWRWNRGRTGQGFIENLEIFGEVQDFIKFSGNITGYD
jgi:hypothetical protein